MPKSSIASFTPSSFSRRMASVASSMFCISALSVISSSRLRGSSPLSVKAERTSATILPSANCSGERLTASRSGPSPCSFQRCTCMQAVRSTQPPMAWIKPLCSATGMKVPGYTSPSSGFCQRNSASTPTMRPD